jgi:NosR/NirI family transcriptional regulator, nitrous oxide reductase regulator
MKFNKLSKTILFLLIALISFQALEMQAQRFPKPEFESGHLQPQTQVPLPRSDFLEFFDVFVLIAAMSLVAWLVLKKRSRRGVFWVSIFSLLYFGFYREGCVCSIGSIQNVALALFNPGYKIPLIVIAFFTLPLIFSLFFGRVFCGGVCPLGAIQDIFVWKPIQMKPWLQTVLGLIPYIYLGLGVLYAATATDFIICRYDPFVGIFRLDAEFMMFTLGGIFLLTSVFVARPYCRFFCPYGVLLHFTSKVSKYHMTITPSKCIQCRLCENSCPFGAIDKPEPIKLKESRKSTVKRFLILSTIIPGLIIIGAWTGYQFHENLAQVDPKVSLAQQVLELKNNPELQVEEFYVEPLEIEAYRSAGKSEEEVFNEASAVISEFKTGSALLGGFIGLAFGLTLAGLSVFKYRKDYEPNKGTCLSCARCMDYCPVEENDDIIIK